MRCRDLQGEPGVPCCVLPVLAAGLLLEPDGGCVTGLELTVGCSVFTSVHALDVSCFPAFYKFPG